MDRIEDGSTSVTKSLSFLTKKQYFSHERRFDKFRFGPQAIKVEVDLNIDNTPQEDLFDQNLLT